MPDCKCVACRVRLRTPGGDLTGEVCPVCEGPLEPVGELSEILGLRLIEPGGEREPVEPLARPISDLTTRREALIEQSRDDIEAVAAALERLPPRLDA